MINRLLVEEAPQLFESRPRHEQDGLTQVPDPLAFYETWVTVRLPRGSDGSSEDESTDPVALCRI